MQEYRYISLPPLDTKPAKGESRDGQVSRLLNDIVREGGWTVVNATRPELLGAVGFLLVRELG